MVNFINGYALKEDKEGVDMRKVLIATLYAAEPVILATTRLGPDKLILLVDEEPDAVQEKSLELIKESLGKVIDVKIQKTDLYDIVSVARKCVHIIDLESLEDAIYINITTGRKTKALGLLFAAYARHNRVKKIAYNPEDEKRVVYLPKLSFKLTNTQKTVLNELAKGKCETHKELSEKVKLSTSMLYRAIDEIRDMDLINTDDFSLTDAGEIARL